MGFKKHDWKRYGSADLIIEIKVLENYTRKLDYFKCNNNEDFKKILKILKQKYDFGD